MRLASMVTRELSVQIVAPIDGPDEVAVVMRYDTADPFAVHAVFRVAEGQEVAWVFARELLTAGLQQPAGDGDVRIWPAVEDGRVSRSDGSRDLVCISLRSPDGAALLHAGADQLAEFLRSAYALCPRGGELRHLKIDRELHALFGG